MKFKLRTALPLCLLLTTNSAFAQTKAKTKTDPAKTEEAKKPAPDAAKTDTPAAPTAPKPTKEQLAEAKLHYERGAALYRDTDYKLAGVEFEETYRIAPSYKILFNLGQVYLNLNRYAEARSALERYLAEGGKEIAPARKAEVEKDLWGLKARTAHVSISFYRMWAPERGKPKEKQPVDGVSVSIDGKQVATPVKNLLIDAGDHSIGTYADGYLTEQPRNITLSGDSTKNLEFEIKPQRSQEQIWAEEDRDKQRVAETAQERKQREEQAAREQEERRKFLEQINGKKDYTWVGWVATGAFAAGATVTGIVALNNRSKFEDYRDKTNAGPVSPDDISGAQTHRDAAKTMGIVTDVLIGATVVAGGISLYFTLKKPKTENVNEKPAPQKAKADMVLSPTYVGVVGTF